MKAGRFVASLFAVILLLFSIDAAAADSFETWSTNFAALTSLEGAGIHTWIKGTQLSLETSNVYSGGKSIKNSGPVDNQHLIQTVFTIKGLTGVDAVDLSDKTLSIEMYVPNGSPLSILFIEVASGNNYITARVNMPAQKGRWYTYDVDINMILALGSWQYWDWAHSPAISSQADAVKLIQSAQYIKVNAQPDSSLQKPTDAYFLIGKLGWKPSGALPAYDPSMDSLRKNGEAKNLLIGGFLDPTASADPSYMHIFFQEFGIGITGTIWPAAEPADGDFNATAQVPADFFLENVDNKTGSPLVRYALGGMDTPGWLIAQSREKAKADLESQVRALASHYKGKTKIWFVFNELLRYDIGWNLYWGLGLKDRTQTPPRTWVNNYSSFCSSPSDVSTIEDAYRVAREADPDALLFLNEGAVEEMGQPRPDAFYHLVQKLVKDGTPIDGVGLQTHLLIGKDGKVHANCGREYDMAFDATNGFKNIAKNVERYSALGLKVAFSEVDASIYTADIDSTPAGQKRLAERLELQAKVYRSLLHIAMTHSNVAAFLLWTWADPYAEWLTHDWPMYGSPGIFDSDYRPKPAYYALLDELKGK